MKREVERTVVDTETVEVRVCDRCGLDADRGQDLMHRSDVIDEIDELAERRYGGLALPLVDARNDVVPAREVHEIARDAAHNARSLRVCSDCYAEMFGWLE